jgi:hypothetical protein
MAGISEHNSEPSEFIILANTWKGGLSKRYHNALKSYEKQIKKIL